MTRSGHLRWVSTLWYGIVTETPPFVLACGSYGNSVFSTRLLLLFCQLFALLVISGSNMPQECCSISNDNTTITELDDALHLKFAEDDAGSVSRQV